MAYVPLTGEEVKEAILRDMRKLLDSDYRFRKAVVYHKISWKCPITLQFWGMPEETVGTSGLVNPKPEGEKIAELEKQLEKSKHHWEREFEEIRRIHKQEIERMRREQPPQQLPMPMEKKPEEPKEPEKEVDGLTLLEESTIVAAQETVEEPERIRLKLEAAEQDSSGEVGTIGRSPEQAHFDHSEYKAPAEAGRGVSIPGKGVRPKNVVGRPQ